MPPQTTDNPYPGLRPFLKSEAHLFFGRENQIDAIVDKLSAARFVTVVGTSGSGKTSLVNCGLQPALHRGLMSNAGTSWKIVQFRPGSRAIAAMTSALSAPDAIYSDYHGSIPLKEIVETSLQISKRGLVDAIEDARLIDGTNVLIVVDQFEELFRYRGVGLTQSDCPERNQEASAFVELLLEARRQTDVPIYIVITMRSDFLGNAAEFPGLPEAINQGQYLVPRMTREEQRSAIQRPARVGGAEISPVLLTRLVNDVGDNPDQLSILQHALNRTWDHWLKQGEDRPIDLPDYEAIGTMAQALDRHAERAFDELKGETARKRCERVFKMLTDRGTDSRGIRRPLEFEKLCTLTGESPENPEELIAILNIFREPTRSFLMPPASEPLQAGTVVDISHESLMRIWERLKEWVGEESLSAQQYIRLSDAARRRPATALWIDPDIHLALEWKKTEQPSEAWAGLYGGGFDTAMAFLAESEAVWAQTVQAKKDSEALELQNAKQAAAEQRARAEKQSRDARRLRWIVAAVFVCLGVALWQWGRASRATDKANSATTWAESQTEKFLAALKDDQNARAAEKIAEKNDLVAEQHAVIALGIAEQEKVRAEHESRRNASHELAQASADGTLALDLRLLLALRAVSLSYEKGEPIEKEAQDALERELQNSEVSRTADLSSGHTQAINSVAFSTTGRRVATGSEDGTTRVWDAVSGLSLMTLTGQPGAVYAVAFSPDGRWLATGGKSKIIDVWDAYSGKQVRCLSGHAGSIKSLAFNRDNKLVSGSYDGTAKLWDVASSQARPLTFSGHTDAVMAVAFSPDGKYVATASKDGSARRWNIADPLEPPLVFFWQPEQDRPLRPSSTVLETLSFSPDGKSLAVGADDGYVKIWTMSDPKDVPLAFDAQTKPVMAVAFSPNGKRLGIGGNTSAVFTRTSQQTVPMVAKMRDLSDPSNKSISLLSPLGSNSSNGLPPTVLSLSFNSNGHQLATSAGSLARVWDTAFGQEVLELADSSVKQAVLAISADGRLVAANGSDGNFRIFDGFSGLEKYTLIKPDDPKTPQSTFDQLFGRTLKSAAFSSSGRFVTVVDTTGVARIWDTGSGKLIHAVGLGYTTGLGYAPSVIALSDDGNKLAAISGRILLLRSADEPSNTTLVSDYVGSSPKLAFSPDGLILAATTADRAVTLWTLGTRKKVVLAQQDGVDAIAFRPHSRQLAIAIRNGSVGLWDTTTGAILSRSIPTGNVYDLAFDESGSKMAALSKLSTLSTDSNLKVWAVDTATELHSVLPLTSGLGLMRLAFQPDGDIFTATGSMFLRRYPLRPRDLLAAAQRHVTRSWTREECLRYLHGACPGYTEALSLIAQGNHLLWEGDSAAALARYDKAGQVEPRLQLDASEEMRHMRVDILLAQGRNLAWTGDSKGASASFQQARNIDPGLAFDVKNAAEHLSVSAALAKGRNLARQGERMGAIESFKLANQLDPSSYTNPEKDADKWIAQTVVAKGVTLAELGNTKGAVEAFNQASKLDSSDDSLRSSREATALRDAGNKLAVSGNIDDASTIYKIALTTDSSLSFDPVFEAKQQRAAGLLSTGLTRAKSGDSKAAVRDFEEALRLDPVGYPQRLSFETSGLRDAGDKQAASGNIADAIFSYESAIKLDPRLAQSLNPSTEANRQWANALRAKANEFIEQKRFQEAFTVLSSMVSIYTASPQLDPNKAIAANSLNSLCWRGSLQRQTTQVMSACNQAVAFTNSTNGSYRDSRGVARALTGDRKGAIQDFQYFADQTNNTDLKKQRLGWIDILSHGGDPFTQSVLDSLTNQ
jgi:WD40 repeat protein/tetratricopeptide (TPR) repeat protein